jgi:orotidine-5'-phosphate decarboxylase
MTREGLYRQILKKRSFLCIGLDTDVQKLPPHLSLSKTPVVDFNRAIIDATHDRAIAYKPNLAFYESRGADGWNDLAWTVNYIRSLDPDIFLIADAKRGDIGNTAAHYARTFFEEMNFDAVTISPYMGRDSIEPFLQYEGKWVILLGITSNPGAEDFQFLYLRNDRYLYEEVIGKASEWAGPDQMMFVAGATRPELIRELRKIIPDHFLLVPGIGAQGGDLRDVALAGMNGQCGLILNSSRSILYADKTESFAEKAGQSALELQQSMEILLDR